MNKKLAFIDLINVANNLFFMFDYCPKLETFYYSDSQCYPYILTFRLYKIPNLTLCEMLKKTFNRVVLEINSMNEVFVHINDNGMPF